MMIEPMVVINVSLRYNVIILPGFLLLITSALYIVITDITFNMPINTLLLHNKLSITTIRYSYVSKCIQKHILRSIKTIAMICL